MKVLVTGANGYIGSRLLPLLDQKAHEITVLVRDPIRLHLPESLQNKIRVVRGDLLDPPSLKNIPDDIEAAYYLVHSMSQHHKDFSELDKTASENFTQRIGETNCKQIIYLSGLVNEKNLSKHLESRFEVENILRKGTCPVTVLRAAIIIGAGSASFEIMRDLVEKLPIMIAPKWVRSQCQPIAIRDVMFYLESVLGNDKCLGQSFDIGGPDVLTYREMMLQMAEVRKLKRLIIQVPVLTPRLSSYWLLLVTSTNFFLARSLIESLKNDAICKDQRIQSLIPRTCLTYKQAIENAFDKIDQHSVISSWKDSVSSGRMPADFLEHVKSPDEGCWKMVTDKPFTIPPEKVYECFTNIGGKNGWYYMNWAWYIRGFIDKLVGGVGLRRGRVSREKLRPGDPLDFWRVLLIDPEHFRLLLYAEMKVPGEAWLEFKITKKGDQYVFTQTATFRPLGVFGRLYWILLLPIHYPLFQGLGTQVIKRASRL